MGDEKVLRDDELHGAGRVMAQNLIDKGAMELLNRACSMADGHKS
jgi:hypothetical protein